MLLEWSLVGRSQERRAVSEVLFAERSAGVVLAGPAGVGKTRLVAEVLDDAGRLHYDVESQMATKSAGTIPFGLFAHLVGSGRFPSRAEMLFRLGEAVAERVERAPLVIAVDDCHLVDEGTAAFLLAIAIEKRARLLVSVRTPAGAPDAVTSLWKDGHLARVDLGPLDAAAIDRLAAQALGGPVETATRHRLRQLCAGNPLFLRELLLAGVQHGFLQDHAGVWCWHGKAVVTERLDELIGSRLAGVSRAEWQVLERLAVAEVLPATMLDSGPDALALEALERRRVVASGWSGSRIEVRFDHPLYGEVLRARLSATARRRQLSELAVLLSSLPGATDDDRFRAAVWRMECDAPGEPGEDLAAAQRALASSEFDLACRLADRAQGAGIGAPAQLVSGHALYWQGHYSAADARLALLVPEATDAEVAEAAIVRSSARFWGLDDVRGATGLVGDALGSVDEPVGRARLNGHLASLLLWSGDPAGGETLASTVMADRHADTVARLRAGVPQALGAAVDGRRRQAADVSSRLMTEAMAHTHLLPLNVGELLAVQAVAEWLGGELPAGAALASDVSQWALEHRSPELLGIFTLLNGQIAADRGKLTQAIADLREATVVLTRQDPGRSLAWAWAALASALGQTGQAGAAVAAAEEARRSARAATRLFDPVIARGEAWAAAAEGAESLGTSTLLAAAEAVAGTGARGAEILLLTDAVRLGGARQAAARLAVLADSADLAHASAAHLLATGLTAQRASLLEQASEKFENQGALLVAAEAAALASRFHRAAGRRSAGVAASERFNHLLASCPGARTPIVVAAASEPLWRLTGREREVATMASRGLSNRAIAAQLTLSERTVENHIARSFAKTGVNSRAELAEILSIPPTEAKA